MTSLLHLRRDAAQATIDVFNNTLFDWGKRDCIRLAAFNLKQLGYKPALARGGYYTSARGALRALKRAGFDTTLEAMDSMRCPRIAPAAALMGDVIAYSHPSMEMAALGVAVGNGRVLAFVEEDGGRCHVIDGHRTLAKAGVAAVAWRCDPRTA
ncbi:MAG TPA: hypothetical protein VGG29_03565 [Caulobacteraceae bacterium]|jgi:hypothetical protein